MNEDPGNRLERREVTRFQVERLKRDFADFLDDPEFAGLARFFFDQVYGGADKRERDAAFERVRDLVARRLGERLGRQLEDLVRLNEMTDRLDDALVERMRSMGIGPGFDEAAYEDAYRSLANAGERAEQIEILCRAIDFFWNLSRSRLAYLWFGTVKRIARLWGGSALLTFLEQGYGAFRRIRNIDRFRAALRSRELARLDRIFGPDRE